jgi:hypothetical protein
MNDMTRHPNVIPAQAGIPLLLLRAGQGSGIPAFAWMTEYMW